MALINGTGMRIYVSGNAIGHATSCSLSFTSEFLETIDKDDTGNWSSGEPGRRSASLAFDGYASEDTTLNSNTVYDLFGVYGLFAAGTLFVWRFSTETTGEKYWTGSGYITQNDINMPVNEKGTVSGTITVIGQPTTGTNS